MEVLSVKTLSENPKSGLPSVDPLRDGETPRRYMKEALAEARRAEAVGEVPVGAVVVGRDGKILGRGFNQPISTQDPTAHAEIVALREACRTVNNYRLVGATLFVTLEPCVLCAGACLLARIETLVFGARDPKAGAVRSLHSLLDDPRHNHRVDVVEGVLADECAELLQAFFRSRRT